MHQSREVSQLSASQRVTYTRYIQRLAVRPLQTQSILCLGRAQVRTAALQMLVSQCTACADCWTKLMLHGGTACSWLDVAGDLLRLHECAYKECCGLRSMQPAYCHCSGFQNEGYGHLGVMQPAGNAAHSRPGKAEAAAQQAAGATLCLQYGMLHLETPGQTRCPSAQADAFIWMYHSS